MASKFTASTKEMVQMLGLSSEKTLFRRRTDYASDRNAAQFLERGLHFQSKSPGASQLVWDPELTKRAWDAACAAQGGAIND